MLRQLWKSQQRKRKQADGRRRRAKLLLRPLGESLESRLALASAIWDGGGADNNWTTAANWVGDAAPSAGDNLVFPGSAAQLTNVNNFAAGTSFGQIVFAGGGYSITGSAIQVFEVTAINPTGTNTFNLGLTLNGPATISSTYAGTQLNLGGAITSGVNITVEGSGNTTTGGIISGAGGIVKNGPGVLTLDGGATNTYAGLTTINAGVLRLGNHFSNAALGSPSAGTVVNAGATLQTTHFNSDVAEPLTLNGHGIAGDALGSVHGALEIGPPAFTTWIGPISLGSDATIGVNHTANLEVESSPVTLNGHKLTINNGGAGSAKFKTPIVDGVGGSGSIDINTSLARGTDYGTVEFQAANTYSGPTFIKAGVLSLVDNGTLVSTNIHVDGAPGVLPFGQTNGFPAPVGVLQLDNSATLNTNRLPDNSTVTMTGGALRFRGRNAAGVASTETIGTIHLDKGQNYIQSEIAAAPGATNALTVGNLLRDSGALVDFTGAGLGTITNQILITSAPTTVGSNGGILPYATVTSATTQDFATYGAGGVAAFTGYAADLATAGPSDIVLVTTPQTVSANKTIGGLLVRTTSTPVGVTVNPDVTFTISHGLLTTSTAPGNAPAALVAGAGAGAAPAVTFGPEGIIHRNTQTTISTAIVGDTALTLGGVAPLGLQPPTAGNSYTGGTTLNSGPVTILANNTPLGAATGVFNFRGGALEINIFVGAVTLPQPVVLDNASPNFSAISTITFSGPVTLTGRNIMAVPSGVTVDLTGQVSGSGSLTLVAATGNGSGGGLLVLSNAANDYAGGTTLVNSGIFTATLQVNNDTALGSGPLSLFGGNLQTGAPVTLNNPVVMASSNIAFTGTNAIALAGPVGATGINTLGGASPAVTISGNISGTGALSKSGTGTITLSGNNTYTGSTTVSQGTLLVNGQQFGTAAGVSAGTLGGVGQLGFIAAAASGVVAPGNPSSAFGTLTANGANFSSGGILRLQVGEDAPTGADFDRLELGSSPLLLGSPSQLDLDLAGLTTARRVLGLVRYGRRDGTSNQFNPVNVLNNGSGHSAELEYTATSLNLTLATDPNDAPSLTLPGAQGGTEDTPIVFSSANGNAITVSDPDAGSAELRLSLGASVGTLTLAGTAGLTFLGGDGTSDAGMEFTGSQAAINAALNGLTYTPPANYAGGATVSVTVDDQGNLGLGGAQSDSGVVNITLLATSDGGSLSISGIPREDRLLQAVLSDADGIPATVSYQWQVDKGIGFVNIAGATSSSFRPGDAQVGGVLRVLANYTDNQGFVESLTSASTGTIVGINDAPVLNVAPNQTLPAIPEDFQTSGGTLVRSLVNTESTDADAGAQRGIAVTALSGTTSGAWQYSLNNGTSWTDFGAVTSATARLLPADAVTRIRFVPNSDFNGTVRIFYRAWDQTEGAAGDTANLSGSGTTGGINAFSRKQEVATLLVAPKNDAPVIGNISGTVGYTAGQAPISLAGGASVSDADGGNLNQGKLIVRITSGKHGSNRLVLGGPVFTIFNDSGVQRIMREGVSIGTLNSGGGVGTTRFEVTFNGNATAGIAQQLVRAIKFRTVGPTPTGERVVEYTLTDGDGGISNQPTKSVNVG